MPGQMCAVSFGTGGSGHGLTSWIWVAGLGGLQHTQWFIGSYTGVEVQKRHVEWCTDNLAGSRFKFVHIDVTNDRYNPEGDRDPTLPADDGSVGVFHAFSVFTHMRSPDVAAYLAEVRRVLTPRGRGFFTVFAEPGVPPEEENPQGYGPFEWRNPLHCVRYSIDHLCEMVASADLKIMRFDHKSALDGQSEVYVAAGTAS